MKSEDNFDFFQTAGTTLEDFLEQHCSKLQRYILKEIDRYDFFLWKRDRKSLSEDILSEAIFRTICYIEKAKSGEVCSLRSFEALCKWHANHVIVDRWRKDQHISMVIDESFFQDGVTMTVMIIDDPCETVITALTQYGQIKLIALEINKLSYKQREAALIHIANETDFDDLAPSPLEQAFWDVGVSLREYCQELPTDSAQRKCYNSNLYLAMKAIRKALCCQNNYQNYHAA